MRGFLSTVCIFILVLSAIAFNKIYLTRTSTKLLQLTQTMKDRVPESIETIESLYQLWEANKSTIQISVSHKRIDTVTDLIDSLRAYTLSKETAEYQKTAELLINALEEIRRFEEFSAVNIL